MIFTSAAFLLFFAIVYAAMLAVRNDQFRRWLLLGASVFFYGFWNAWYLLLLAGVILMSWYCGAGIAAARTPNGRRAFLVLGVALSLSALAIFKYSGFVARIGARLFGWPVPGVVSGLLLPIGISFYTFHAISYCVDIYRGQVKKLPGLREYAIYIAFFPQLISGPITRAHQFLPQLARPLTLTAEGFRGGARLFAIGAVQKLLLADQVSPFVDQVFAAPSLYSGLTDWLAVLAYALQIFCDFSGYSLMAIGLGRILGYSLPENFRMPYLATSIVDFWRRWNMTLSFFLRDYLYIPIGGNRRGFARAQINVMVTMLLGGLWHGASWNFVLWGAIHGAAIVVHRLWERTNFKLWGPVFTPVSWLLTFATVVLAWIPFRAHSLGAMGNLLHGMLSLSDGIVWYHTPTCIALAAAVAWHGAFAMGLHRQALRLLGQRWMNVVEVAVMATLLLLFMPLDTSPFIYFQF